MIRVDLLLREQYYVGRTKGSDVVSWYNKYTGNSFPLNTSWCAMAQTKILNECGIIVVPAFHSCTAIMDWAKGAGVWHEPEKTFMPRPTDLILFDWDKSGDADHVGMVSGFDGTYVYTTEGNSSNEFRRKKYVYTNDQIRGYIRPNYPDNGTLFGVDVSRYQTNINYALVSEYVDFMIVRGSFTYTGSKKIEADASFRSHYSGAHMKGIPLGYYHFSAATTETELTNELYFSLEQMKDNEFELGFWLDVESEPMKKLSKETMMNFMQIAKDICASYNVRFGLYTGKYWLNTYFDVPKLKEMNIPIWYAQYNTQITYSDPSAIDIWQFNSGGDGAGYNIMIPGITSNGLDVNVSYQPLSYYSADTPKIIKLKNGWYEENDAWCYYENNGRVKDRWIQSADKLNWYYIGSKGNMVEGCWEKIVGKWYLFDDDGKMMRGWVKRNGLIYYLTDDGDAATGWKKLTWEGKTDWYYFGTDSDKEVTCALCFNKWIQNVSDANIWYYVNEQGIMLKNTTKVIDGKIYVFNNDGVSKLQQ